MFTKQTIILLAGLCAAAGIIGIYTLKQQPKAANTLVLGTMSGWPPFVSIAPDGSYEGFDIDIAKIIAQKLGKNLEIKDMDTALLISDLDQGRVDYIMTGLDSTPERVKRMTMVPYQGDPITEYPLIFFESIPEGIESLADLNKIPNAVICVESGSSQEEVLKNYSGFEVKNVDPLIGLLEVKNGRATAAFLDLKMAQSFLDKEPRLIPKMMPLSNKEVILGCGIGINKKNKELSDTIQAIIDTLKASGELQALETKWFKGS